MVTVIWGVNVINFLLNVSWLCRLNRCFCLSKTGQARCFVSPLAHTFVSLRQLLANQPSTEKRPEPAKNSRTNTNKAPVLQFYCTLGSNMFNIFFMFLFCYLLIPQHYYKLNFLSTWATKCSPPNRGLCVCATSLILLLTLLIADSTTCISSASMLKSLTVSIFSLFICCSWFSLTLSVTTVPRLHACNSTCVRSA